MKFAVSGKGGVGKTTLAAAMSILLARRGIKVLAVDADPDANLAGALGLSLEEQQKIIPVSRQAELIEERTGARVKQYGQIFKLNPEVSDIADKYATSIGNVALLVLGAVADGGSGCACPENVLLRTLVTDLILYKDNAVIMDMEAGVEHLGRATAGGVDSMIIVVEPGQNSIDSTERVIRMAGEIGLENIRLVANKVNSEDDEKFIRNAFPGQDLLGIIPYSDNIRQSDRTGKSVIDGQSGDLLSIFNEILDNAIK